MVMVLEAPLGSLYIYASKNLRKACQAAPLVRWKCQTGEACQAAPLVRWRCQLIPLRPTSTHVLPRHTILQNPMITTLMGININGLLGGCMLHRSTENTMGCISPHYILTLILSKFQLNIFQGIRTIFIL